MSEKGTEQATPQRRQKAKESGDIVRSRELLSALSMLAGIFALGAVSKGFLVAWGGVYVQCLRMGAGSEITETALHQMVRTVFIPVWKPLGIVLASSFAAALCLGIAQGGGLSFHPQALEMKFERFNPVANLQHLFGLRAANRLLKSLIPAAAMMLLGWTALRNSLTTVPAMSFLHIPLVFALVYRLALDAGFLMLAWSALDYAVEWRSRNERLKMTKQEIRQEMKDAMGNPEVKGRMRQIQRAMRRRRIKTDISRASVVITNPTHYAVALEFSFDTMHAPTVLAKGRDLHAADIREEARWAGVPIVENPPLARSLYRAVEPGQSIPFELYAAVAGILAFLYRQKVEEKMRREKAGDEAAARRASVTRAGLPGFGGGI